MYLCSKFQSFISRNYTCSPHESSRPSAGDLPARERLTINRWRVKPSMASLRIDFLCFIGTIVYNNLWMEVCLPVNSQNANCKTSICRLVFFIFLTGGLATKTWALPWLAYPANGFNGHSRNRFIGATYHIITA